MSDTRRFHVFRRQERSGITAYAEVFHDLVLDPCGYEVLDPEAVITGRFRPRSDDEFHVQLGIFQHPERLALSTLQRHRSRAIDATLHDPPFTSFPYFAFQSAALNRLARGFDWYARSLGLQGRAIKRLRRAFVLSHKGATALLRRYPGANVEVMPHIVDEAAIWPAAGVPPPAAALYFGFIGPNKGLERALELHRLIRAVRPETQLHVVGAVKGRANEKYLAGLQERFSEKVTYHGFAPASELDGIFGGAGHAILPYQSSPYVVPMSGSILNALCRGLVCWVTPVNAIPELIVDGENGFFLSGDATADAARIVAVMGDPEQCLAVSRQARETALRLARYPYRQHFQ